MFYNGFISRYIGILTLHFVLFLLIRLPHIDINFDTISKVEVISVDVDAVSLRLEISLKTYYGRMQKSPDSMHCLLTLFLQTFKNFVHKSFLRTTLLNG